MPDKETRLRSALHKIWEGDAEGGLQDLRNLVRDHPDYLDAWGNLGHQLITRGELTEAIECCKKLIEIQPELIEAYQKMGDCYYALGRKREAYRVYRSLEGNPVYETEDWQRRLALTEPLLLRCARRALPSGWKILRKGFEPGFLCAFLRELFDLPHSIPGIRQAGGAAFLSYLNQHYLEGHHYVHSTAPCEFCGSTRFRAVFFYRHNKIVKCRSCGLECVERRPKDGQDVAEGAFEREETIQSFEKMWNDPVLFQVRQSYLESLFEEAGEDFPTPGKRLLEIGCGQGHKLHHLARCGMDVVGTETGNKIIEQAKRRFGLDIRLATVRNLPFSDREFDFILAYHVLEHLDHPSQLFEQAFRLLKPGGFLFVEIPTSDLTRFNLPEQLNDAAGYANTAHMFFFQPETVAPFFPRFGFDLIASYNRKMGRFDIGGFLGKRRVRESS